ncbi:MAG: S4 domain-containing protein [Culicoidibacterales bacterium]
MRIDKFLKVSRIIKRRTIAQEILEMGRVSSKDKILKPGTKLKVGDVFTIHFAKAPVTYRVLSLNEKVTNDTYQTLYEVVYETGDENA